MAAAPTIQDYDPFAPDLYTSDPFGVYRWMRDEAPVHRSERWGWWVLTRFDDVRAAALDAETFRSFEGMDTDDSRLEQAPPGSIGSMGNPRHDQVRQGVQPYFLPRRIAELEEPHVEAVRHRTTTVTLATSEWETEARVAGKQVVADGVVTLMICVSRSCSDRLVLDP